ncbi:FMN-dependent NADH-azoreductase [Aeromonas hydrophila]|uniref:FMN-dependent NADH-azoreductase n=1 Tax=Aeromonas hydrophila TaxID=644 RepID=UPI002B4924AA|nr:NAD(P)H-dependent oxidoreductase [Aeromonas hydrophila]
MKLLQITSSPRGTESTSTMLANKITNKIKEAYPDIQVTQRDLIKEPHPLIDTFTLNALFTEPQARTIEQKNRVMLDDSLINQIMETDIIVIGAPMYNFGIPVQLKAWLDAICRVGATFTYDENGSTGLVSGKKIYLAASRGGNYLGMPEDYQLPYLQHVLGFLGMTDIQLVVAEGLDMGPDAQQTGYANAYEQLNNISIG